MAAKKITIPVAKMDKESANKYRYAGLPPIDGIYVLKSAFEGKPPASATLVFEYDDSDSGVKK